MKNTYTLSECKKIYENPAFLKKLKEISDAPAVTTESMYYTVHKSYKGDLKNLKGTDADPYGLLYIIEAAENGDDNAVNLALGSTKIAPLEKEGKDGIIDYWGKKAITYRCSTSCATLNCLLHGTNAPEEIKFAAARWGMADSSPLGKLAGVQFLTFAEKYPDSFEGKSAMLTEQTNEVVLQDIFEEGLVQKDYPVCFYIAFLLRERGAILPLPKIFELCKNAEVESFYYLFSGEPMPDRIDRKVCRNECIHMDQYAKQAVRVMHKEIFLRAMFDYSVTYLGTNIEPFAATATHCISDRGAYETQAEDLGVVLQASYHSAKEVENEELMQNSEQGYRQIVMERLFSGHPMNIPGLKDAVDQERLRRAIYYNKEAPAEEENGEKGNPVREQNDTEIKSCQPTFCGTESVPAGDLNNPENVLWNECSQMSEGVAMVEFEDGEAGEYVFLFPVSVGDRVSVNGLHIGKIGKVCKLGTCENSLELPEITAVVQKSSVSSESVQSSATEPYLKKRKITKKQSIIIVCAIALVVILLATLLPLCLRQDTSGLVIRNLKIDGNVITWDEAPDADSYMVVLDGARFDGQYYDPSDAKRKNVNSPNCELPFNEGEPYRVSVSAVIEEGGHTYPYRVTYRYYGTVTFEYQPEYFTVTWKNIDGNNSSASKRLEPNQKFDFTYDNVDKGDPNDDTQMYCQGWFSDVALTKEVTEEFVLKQDITLYGKWQKDYLQMTDGVLVDVKTFSEEVSVPAAITAIDDYAFYGCGTLKRITIPSNVQTIGRYAFKDCTALEIVSISEGVQIVGERAFENCTALREIHIAQSVKSFGSAAFIGCENLENVYIKSIADWCLIGFEDFTGNPLSFAKNLYADGLITDLIVPETTDKIGDYAFSGFEGLRSILISDSVESIGIYAFSGCVNLTGVTVGRGVRSIGMRAFSECGSLKSIFIPDSVSEMGEYVFEKNNITVNCQAEAEPHEWDDDWDKAFWTVSSEYEVNVVWGAKDPDTLKTYVFHSNGGTEVDPLVDDAVYTCPVTTNGDMAFMGWYDNAALDGKAIAFPYTGQATEFYAKWETRDGSSFAKALILEINEFGSGWYIYTSTTEMYFMFTLPSSYTGAEVYSITVTDGSSIIGINVDYAVYDASGREINYFVSKGKYYLSNGETYYLRVSLREGTKINVSIEK